MQSDGNELLELEGSESLRSCCGFTVYFGDGRVGRITEVLSGPGPGRPRALLVETGLFQRRSVEVPIVDVASVVAARRRVNLRLVEKQYG